MGIPLLNRVRERYGLKLTVAFTAVLLVTVGVGTVVSADASAQLRDDAEQQLVGTADERADRIDAWLTGVTTDADADPDPTPAAAD